jgi:hypothetical protein
VGVRARGSGSMVRHALGEVSVVETGERHIRQQPTIACWIKNQTQSRMTYKRAAAHMGLADIDGSVLEPLFAVANPQGRMARRRRKTVEDG